MTMSLMDWEDKYALGIDEFDQHHKQLIKLLNMTYDGIANGAGNEELSVVLDELLKYATYHFSAEEHWMKEHRYPDLLRHINEHEIFILRVLKFYRDLCSEKVHLPLEVLHFLKNWLATHIIDTDAAYGRFANGLSHT
jgi:hemerythrin